MTCFDFCIPAPKKVSGALPTYKFLDLAKFNNSLPSSNSMEIGFSE